MISTIVRSGFQIVGAKPSHLWMLYGYGVQASQYIFVSLTIIAAVVVSFSGTLMVTSVILRLNLDWASLFASPAIVGVGYLMSFPSWQKFRRFRND